MRRSKSQEDQATQAKELKLAKQFQQEYSQASSSIINEAAEESKAAESKIEKEKKTLEEKAAAERKNLRIQMAEQWERANIEKIKTHKVTIFRKYWEAISEDDYGNIDMSEWTQVEDYVGKPIYQVKIDAFRDSRSFYSGFPYFWKNVLIEDGDARGDLWFEGWHSYRQEMLGNSTEQEWYEIIFDWIKIYAIDPVAKELDAQEEERIEAGYSDDMSGADYEIYCGRILQEAGWNVEQTQASNDQGVDLIAQIEDLKVCIQCKRYSNPVGNKAVQEVIAGKAFYNGTHAVVVSNAGFTKAAKSLAESANVILISDTELEDLETMV